MDRGIQPRRSRSPRSVLPGGVALGFVQLAIRSGIKGLTKCGVPPTAISESVTCCARSERCFISDLGRAPCSASKKPRSPQNRRVLLELPQKGRGTRSALSEALSRAPLFRGWALNASWATRLPDCRFPSARQLGAANAFITISRIVARVLVVRRSAMGWEGLGSGPRGARRADGAPTIAPICKRYGLQRRETMIASAGKLREGVWATGQREIYRCSLVAYGT